MDARFLFRLIAVVLAALVLLALSTEAQDMNGPPERPKVFRNPEELREYLKALNEYFAIVGRPRFGRSVMKRSASAFRRSLGTPSAFNELDLDGDRLISPMEFELFMNDFYKK